MTKKALQAANYALATRSLGENQVDAIRKSQAGSASFVPHIGLEEVQALASLVEIRGKGRNGERDRLLIESMFDGCFRVSEALGIRPSDLVGSSFGWSVRIIGKGQKPGEAAISASLAARLQSCAYRHGVSPEERFSPISPARAWQIVDRAFKLSGIQKPNHVGTSPRPAAQWGYRPIGCHRQPQSRARPTEAH